MTMNPLMSPLTWRARGLAVAALVALGIAAGTTPAFAAGTYPTLAASNIRSGPSTAYPILKTVAKGTQLTIDCYVSGQSISGTTIWNHVPAVNGYISDSLLLTGSARAVVPACGAASPAPVPAPAPAASREDKAVAWALSQVGSNDYSTVTTVNGRTQIVGWCLRFAANAYGRTAAGYETAIDMYNALRSAGQVRTGTAPKGALVFSKSSYDGGAGHVAVATGDGRFVSGGVDPTRVINGRKASVNVFSSPNPSTGSTVLGWAYAPSSWTGR